MTQKHLNPFHNYKEFLWNNYLFGGLIRNRQTKEEQC